MNYADQHVKSCISVKATHGLYSPVLMILLAFATIFSGCKKDTKRDLYTQSYDELVTYYINIDSLAKGMDVKVENLIKMRYGLLNTSEKTQKEIAKKLGISRSYVSRIEKRALIKMLREFIKNNN